MNAIAIPVPIIVIGSGTAVTDIRADGATELVKGMTVLDKSTRVIRTEARALVVLSPRKIKFDEV